MTTQPRLFLIDGHALAYRTYFALTRAGDPSRWITKSGEPTAGTYGFVSVLLSLLEREKPEYLAVSFDTGRTFRDDLFAEYKATREKMPDDLRLQIKRIREIIAAFGIPILEAEGYEADDVLGTVARQASAQGVHTIIVTGDRDLLQLATDDVTIQLSGQKLSEATDYGPEQVRERYDLDPGQLVDLKALVGDSSDNIPGVRGVGEKTATSLLQKYHTLDNIFANLAEVQSRFRNKLEQGRDDAYLSKKLGQIETDVPIEFNLESCRAQAYNRDEIVDIFRELEFRTLLNRIQIDEESGEHQMSLFVSDQQGGSAGSRTVHIVDDAEKLKNLIQRLEAAERVAFDVETTSTDEMQADLVGISLATQPEEGYYIPVGHVAAQAGAQLPLETVIEALRGPLTDSGKPKVGHNLKYDYTLLARSGLRASPLAFDTMLAEWLCDPASRSLGLKNLAWIRLGVEMTEIETLIGRGKNQRSMAEVPIAEVAPYAAADAEICLRLLPILEKELKEKNQTKLFQELEMPLIPILAQMEMTGISLDIEFLRQLSRELQERMAKIETKIFEEAGSQFNVNSTQQLSAVLFEDLKLAPPDRARRTASGHYSTAASVLEELREAHPIVDDILAYREIAKIKSTYADALPQEVNPRTGRVHTSFNQTGSVTGRLASSNPNLQNIPVRTEIGREIRRAFIADSGHTLLSVDYSQIELRIVAHISEDEAMLQAFRDDQDIHSATAAAIFGVKPADVTPNLRRRAKAINFGLIYGMSPFGLTRSTDLTLAEAENFVKAYFDRFPGVQRYLEQIRQQASQVGYVSTLLGRRRYFPQLVAGSAVSEQARARAMREAINAPIQGTASDIIKIAMIRLPQALAEEKSKADMLIQVHDELVLECPQSELTKTTAVVQKIMQGAFDLRVPLKTDAKAGVTWASMKPVD
ncbi:MAG: DNA polymerase I [Anaerolineales bacterium]|jgi:DNA polymerase-1